MIHQFYYRWYSKPDNLLSSLRLLSLASSFIICYIYFTRRLREYLLCKVPPKLSRTQLSSPCWSSHVATTLASAWGKGLKNRSKWWFNERLQENRKTNSQCWVMKTKMIIKTQTTRFLLICLNPYQNNPPPSVSMSQGRPFLQLCIRSRLATVYWWATDHFVVAHFLWSLCPVSPHSHSALLCQYVAHHTQWVHI